MGVRVRGKATARPKEVRGPTLEMGCRAVGPPDVSERSASAMPIETGASIFSAAQVGTVPRPPPEAVKPR